MKKCKGKGCCRTVTVEWNGLVYTLLVGDHFEITLGDYYKVAPIRIVSIA